MKIILNVRNDKDMDCAIRAARWLLLKPITQKDAVLAYGVEGVAEKDKDHFYVKRNKSSISVTWIE